jgi:hypothetical protein
MPSIASERGARRPYSRRPHWRTPLSVESHEDLLQFDHHLTFHIAEAHAVMGDRARALDLVESAVVEAKRRWEAFQP